MFCLGSLLMFIRRLALLKIYFLFGGSPVLHAQFDFEEEKAPFLGNAQLSISKKPTLEDKPRRKAGQRKDEIDTLKFYLAEYGLDDTFKEHLQGFFVSWTAEEMKTQMEDKIHQGDKKNFYQEDELVPLSILTAYQFEKEILKTTFEFPPSDCRTFFQSLILPQWCHEVESLDFSNQKLKFIPSILYAFEGLRDLNISHNKIKDISMISKFRRLQYLDISHNKIGNLSYIHDLKNAEVKDKKQSKVARFNYIVLGTIVDFIKN